MQVFQENIFPIVCLFIEHKIFKGASIYRWKRIINDIMINFAYRVLPQFHKSFPRKLEVIVEKMEFELIYDSLLLFPRLSQF